MKYFATFGLLLLIGAGCTGTLDVDEANDAVNINFKANENSEASEADENTPNKENMNEDKTYAFPGLLPEDRIKNKQVRLKTKNGDIVIKFLDEVAPKTVSNFVYLTEEGYYNGLTFHRVIADFMVQGGDPAGTGSGGPGYNFEDEFSKDVNFDEPGLLAMANRGPATNGSQFFITTVPTPHLHMAHTIFGKVTEGMEIVLKIEGGDEMVEVIIEDAK